MSSGLHLKEEWTPECKSQPVLSYPSERVATVPAAASAAVHLLTPAHMCTPHQLACHLEQAQPHCFRRLHAPELRAGVQELLLPVIRTGISKPQACGRVSQVMELAQDGTKAMGQWLRLELLKHVQQLAACRNVGVT